MAMFRYQRGSWIHPIIAWIIQSYFVDTKKRARMLISEVDKSTGIGSRWLILWQVWFGFLSMHIWCLERQQKSLSSPWVPGLVEYLFLYYLNSDLFFVVVFWQFEIWHSFLNFKFIDSLRRSRFIAKVTAYSSSVNASFETSLNDLKLPCLALSTFPLDIVLPHRTWPLH